ncbi:MAG: acetyl-CoA carboxylase, carboxyltransferase subunit beta, partial [Lachnospiraceae bacterium]|nr:acetyl-CoA carboxylase, carboxyltransferase subunit beta [Lachnospiraceae bacterium]
MDTANIPENLICKCKKCNSVVFVQDVKENNYSCPKCGRYFRMHAKRRIKSVADKGSFEPWFEGMEVQNPLDYDNYPEKIAQLKEKTGLDEAVITGKVTIGGKPACVAAMDGRFLMASMGRIVGEKITRTVERATEENLPVIIFACSGGARMQEGIVSLMQMAKTSAALKRHSDSGNLYISVLTDPTTGGVTASFAMLGDIILAEPKALIGFAGPRVIEQTIGQKLPKGFQRSEFLLEHGFIDAIVPREEMRDTLDRILTMHAKEKQEVTQPLTVNLTPFKHGMELSPWERVQVSRRNDRPVGEDYIQAIFPDFIEFHGDRYYKDDASIIGGIATLG